ncbi:MAG: hypothetical protein QY316_05395 [Thermodesulfobacteriota bacterium]|nr:MAG: hypothetical protein QY316_05395 [Thermodesulfobacteriota bacterium]
MITMLKLEDLEKELAISSLRMVLNEHILGGEPICFSKDKKLVYILKRKIADYFGIHLKMIEIVGSAKLGISLSDTRWGKKFDNKSDIDLAIVSPELFDKAWDDLRELDSNYYSLKDQDIVFLKECFRDIPDGYISPDKLPKKSEFRKKWWQIFIDLSSKEEFEYRKIRGRLFRSWFFVEKYYSIQLRKIKGAK